jgi:hypothetical protein
MGRNKKVDEVKLFARVRPRRGRDSRSAETKELSEDVGLSHKFSVNAFARKKLINNNECKMVTVQVTVKKFPLTVKKFPFSIKLAPPLLNI